MADARRFPEMETEPKIGVFARMRAAWEATRDLFATRAKILQEELAEKGSLLGRGAMGVGIALVLGWLALLLLTALIAVLFTSLFGTLWAGLLTAFGLYLAGAAAAGFAGWRAFAKFRPLDFPATKEGLREDWSAIRDSLRTPPPTSDDDETDLEERFRAGSE